MTLPEVEERYNKNITALKSLEQILKALDASYDVHITRLGWLKHLADSSFDLKKLEVEAIRSAQIAAQVAQQQQAHLAQQQQAQLAQQQAQMAQQQVQQASVKEEAPKAVQPQQPMPASQPDQESAKKSRKKVE